MNLNWKAGYAICKTVQKLIKLICECIWWRHTGYITTQRVSCKANLGKPLCGNLAYACPMYTADMHIAHTPVFVNAYMHACASEACTHLNLPDIWAPGALGITIAITLVLHFYSLLLKSHTDPPTLNWSNSYSPHLTNHPSENIIPYENFNFLWKQMSPFVHSGPNGIMRVIATRFAIHPVLPLAQ